MPRIKYTNPWDPLGQALLDYQAGDTSAKITVFSDFELPRELPVSHFFREPDDFPPLEQTAISLCNGLVLDIGAGAGCHSLALQELGHPVQAIDVIPQAVDVMSARGIKNTKCADFFSYNTDDEKFDTLLLLMNGIGIVEDFKGLIRFLSHAGTLLAQDGHLVFDSVDFRETCTALELASREKSNNGEYYGVVNYNWSYKNVRGPDFQWLYIDTDTLTDIASKSGWHCEGIYPEDEGRYVARLAR